MSVLPGLKMCCRTLSFTPLIWWMLPNSPTTASFLRQGNDRLIALERIRENNTGTKVRETEVFYAPR
jgi:hypothetical protein